MAVLCACLFARCSCVIERVWPEVLINCLFASFDVAGTLPAFYISIVSLAKHHLNEQLPNMRGFVVLSYVSSTISAVSATLPLISRQEGNGSNGGNLSLEYPELFSLHWQLLEQNSTSGFETPVVDFLSGFLEDQGLTVELQPVQNPILPYEILSGACVETCN